MSNFILTLWQKIESFFKNPDVDSKVKAIIKRTTGIVLEALPIAKAIALITPTPIDDVVVSQVEFWTQKVQSIGLDPQNVFVNGAKLAFNAHFLREWLLSEIEENGFVEYGGTRFISKEAILALKDSEIQSYAQLAYAISKVVPND